MKTFLPHQKRAYEYAMRVQHPALFLEMRLGKTLVAIRAARARGCARVLIVAPLGTMPMWDAALREEGIIPRWIRPGTALWGKVPPDIGWLIANYEAIRAQPALIDESWDAAIADESTRIKNPRAQITRLFISGFRDVTHRFVLSGLPIPETELELFTQIKFLRGSAFGCNNYYVFRQRFFTQAGFEWIPKPETPGIIKQFFRDETFSLSRKEAGVGNAKEYRQRVIPLTVQQESIYRELESTFASEILGIETKWKPVQYSWLLQLASGFLPNKRCIGEGKIQELLWLLQNEFAREKVVVYAHHLTEIELIARRLTENRISVEAIYGSVPPQEREKRRIRFTKDVRVLLCQPQTVQHGQDFSASSTVIFFSNVASLEIRAQCEDRIEHMAKKEPLLYVDLVAENTVDEDLIKALREKKLNAQSLLARIRENLHARKASQMVDGARSGNVNRRSIVPMGKAGSDTNVLVVRKRPR